MSSLIFDDDEVSQHHVLVVDGEGLFGLIDETTKISLVLKYELISEHIYLLVLVDKLEVFGTWWKWSISTVLTMDIVCTVESSLVSGDR